MLVDLSMLRALKKHSQRTTTVLFKVRKRQSRAVSGQSSTVLVETVRSGNGIAAVMVLQVLAAVELMVEVVGIAAAVAVAEVGAEGEATVMCGELSTAAAAAAAAVRAVVAVCSVDTTSVPRIISDCWCTCSLSVS
jgi:hypothetical protein